MLQNIYIGNKNCKNLNFFRKSCLNCIMIVMNLKLETTNKGTFEVKKEITEFFRRILKYNISITTVQVK